MCSLHLHVFSIRNIIISSILRLSISVIFTITCCGNSVLWWSSCGRWKNDWRWSDIFYIVSVGTRLHSWGLCILLFLSLPSIIECANEYSKGMWFCCQFPCLHFSGNWLILCWYFVILWSVFFGGTLYCWYFCILQRLAFSHIIRAVF